MTDTMIDKTKQYKTRYGLPVEIYATNRGGKFPVHGAVFKDDRWVQYSWTSEGKHVTAGASSSDLIEVRPQIKRTLWVNVYDDFFNSHASREEADRRAVLGRLACIQIEIDCEEGEGL